MFDKEKILRKISLAFSNRNRPGILFSSEELTPDEIEEVNGFSNLDWRAVDQELLHTNCYAFSWFSSDAFCYYLPSVMSISIAENACDLLVIDFIIGGLDRSPVPANWDDFFLNRWTLFTQDEYGAIEEWLNWLFSQENYYPAHANTKERVLETVAFLKDGVTGISSTMRKG